MTKYTVSVVLENVELTDAAIDRLFAVVPDAVASEMNGVVRVTAPIQATDGESAAFRLIEQLAAAIPEAVPLRLDQDLVSIADIAERTGRSRESVRQLVDGKRGPGGFPVPVGTVGDAIRVWPWAVVLEWFRDRRGEDLGEHGVSPDAAALVDACLAGRRGLGLMHQRLATWTPAAHRAGKRVVAVCDAPTGSRDDVALTA